MNNTAHCTEDFCDIAAPCTRMITINDKVPLIKELRVEQKKLKAEREKLNLELGNEKPELDELKNMRKNINLFLGVSDTQEQERSRKRSGELE